MKAIIKLLAGLFILSAALVCYIPRIGHIYELTFISNFVCSLVLIADGITTACKKRFPLIFYHLAMPLIFAVFCTVFFTLSGLHRFTFRGGYLFLHGLDAPLILAVYYFFAPYKKYSRRQQVMFSLVSPAWLMCFFAFDFFVFLFYGRFIYGLIPAGYASAPVLAAAAAGIYLSAALFTFVVMNVKEMIGKRAGRSVR